MSSNALVIVTSAQFRPSHATLEMEQKLKKIGQYYWAIQLAKETLAKEPTGFNALVVQRLQQERQELIATLPLYGIQGGK